MDGETPFEPQDGQRVESDDGAPIWAEVPAEPEETPILSDRQLAQALARAMGMSDKQLEAFRRKAATL